LLTVDSDGAPRQRPHPALQSLRGEQTSIGPLRVAEGVTLLRGIEGDALEIMLNLHLEEATAAGLRLCCADDGTRGIDIRWDGAVLTVAGCSTALRADGERTLTLHIFLDKCLIEVFAAGGHVAMTRIVAPADGDLAVAAFAEGGAAQIDDLAAWQIKGIGRTSAVA
jgi:beta-fructofuranosidase